MLNDNSATLEDLALFRRDFSHDDQIRLCAKHLELMKLDMGVQWAKWSLVKPGKRRRGEEPGDGGWTPERVSLAGHFVRHACESADFYKTVDFVTTGALGAIRNSRARYPRRTTFHLKQWTHFSHEHMVPGSAVLRILTAPAADVEGGLYELLAAVSFRALVAGTKCQRVAGVPNCDVGSLDSKYGSCLPAPEAVPGWRGPMTLNEIAPCYYAFMRYDAAGLLDELIAVTPRGQNALDKYVVYKASFVENRSGESPLLIAP